VCVLRALVRLPALLSLEADVALRTPLIPRRLARLLVGAVVLILPSLVVVVVSHGLE